MLLALALPGMRLRSEGSGLIEQLQPLFDSLVILMTIVFLFQESLMESWPARSGAITMLQR
jgi:hypothetical protein